MGNRRNFFKALVAVPVGLGLLLRGAKAAAPVRRIFLKEIFVAGLQYHDGIKPGVLDRLRVGDTLVLNREPHNPHDEYAIAIHTARGAMVGYIPRYQNRTIARMMDQGVPIRAEVAALDLDAVTWQRMAVKVEQEIAAH